MNCLKNKSLTPLHATAWSYYPIHFQLGGHQQPHPASNQGSEPKPHPSHLENLSSRRCWMRGERRSSRLWEQKTPDKLWDRSGFLHPEYPSNGLVFPFPLYACEYAAAPKQERKGKHKGVNLLPRKRTRCSQLPKTSLWGFFAEAKGQPRAGHAKKAAWESSDPGQGILGEPKDKHGKKMD